MYSNAGYLANVHEEVLSGTEPLVVGSCGTYRPGPGEHLKTLRPEGRGDWQLLYVAAGQARFRKGTASLTLDAGSMVVYEPGEAQDYVYYGADGAEVFWVHFSGVEARGLLEGAGLVGTEAAEWLACGRRQAFRDAFVSIIGELQLRAFGFRELCALRLRELLVLIARARHEGGGEPRMSEAIRKAVLHLNAHLDEPLDVHALARRLGMSASGLTAAFKRATGLPPKRYLTTMRMRRATTLLEGTEHTVAEVARMVGYDNPLYFSRLYRSYTGHPPSAARNS